METIVIGDIHGKSLWKKMVEKNKDADKVIFVGDYFDSFNITPLEQLNNFNEICNFKREKGLDKVVMILGNHDHHYYPGVLGGDTSGYQPRMKTSFEFSILRNIDLLCMAYVDEYNNVYSHGGITKTWLNDVGIINKNIDTEITDINKIVSDINDLLLYRPNSFLFYPNDISGFGNNIHQSPIWVRPESLYKDKIPFNQIIGHTPQNKINSLKSGRQGYWLIDTLDTSKEYLKIIDGKIKVKKIK